MADYPDPIAMLYAAVPDTVSASLEVAMLMAESLPCQIPVEDDKVSD